MLRTMETVWKHICCILLCVVLLMSMTVTSFGDTGRMGKQTLRVAFYPLNGFFEYDENGKEIGYGVELLNRISMYTGIHFTYVYADSWEETKHMLLEGDADIRMPGTLPSKPSETLDYTEQGVIDTYYAMMSLKDRKDLYYQDYEVFHTLKVGMSQSLSCYRRAEAK